MYNNYTRAILGNVEAEIMQTYLDLKEHYFSEICKKTKIARPSVMRTLRKLEKIGVLEASKKANTKFYKLLKTRISIMLLSLLEYDKSSKFLESNKKIKYSTDVLSEELQPIAMIIFGSYAKGTHEKHSDVDLLLIMNFDKKTIRKSEDIVKTIYGRTGLRVSPIMMTIKDLKKKNAFVQEVIDFHVIIKGAEIFYEVIL
jgi:predicted nucleotidyltransferase